MILNKDGEKGNYESGPMCPSIILEVIKIC